MGSPSGGAHTCSLTPFSTLPSAKGPWAGQAPVGKVPGAAGLAGPCPPSDLCPQSRSHPKPGCLSSLDLPDYLVRRRRVAKIPQTRGSTPSAKAQPPRAALRSRFVARGALPWLGAQELGFGDRPGVAHPGWAPALLCPAPARLPKPVCLSMCLYIM